jgi:hypothetical protein
MNKKYFCLLLVSTILYCFSTSGLAANHSLNNVQKGIKITDTLKWIKMGAYDGKDSTFVKDQSPSAGIAGCTAINKEVGGIIISIVYTLNKQGGASVPVVSSIQIKSRHSTSGKDPIEYMSHASEIRGNTIAFSIASIDIISWHGEPWGAVTMINGTYDTSTGAYSMQIDQQTPENP